MLKLGVISYLNSFPLLPFIPNYCHVERAPPRQLSEQLLRGQLDAAFISSAALLNHKEQLSSQYKLGIAANNEVKSVCLYTRKEPSQIASIALSPESLSSVALLKILCEKLWKIKATHRVYTQPEQAPCDAYLLIGDAALNHKSPLETLDLAQGWRSLTGLPFVFGCYCYRKDLFPEKYRLALELENKLADHPLSFSSLEEAQTLLEPLGVPAQQLSERSLQYWQLLHYKLNGADRQSLNLFEQLGGLSCLPPLYTKSQNKKESQGCLLR